MSHFRTSWSPTLQRSIYAFLLCAVAAYSQVITGSIVGTLLDPGGNAVAGASVAVSNTALTPTPR